MKKNLIKMMAVIAASASLSSCLGDNDNDVKYTMAYTNFFNVVKELSTGSTYYYTGIGYAINYNATKATAELTVEGLVVPSGSYTSLTFSELPWTVSTNGWRNIQVTNVVPTATTLVPTFNSLTFNVYDRYVLTSSYYPAYNIQYRINDLYQVYSFPAGVINVGTTTAIDQDGTAYTTSGDQTATVAINFYATSTSINLNNADERNGSIALYNAQFSSTMQEVNLVIPDVKWNATGSNITFSADGPIQIQKINDNQVLEDYGDYKVTDLYCNTDGANAMVLTYKLSSITDGVTYQISTTSTTPSN